MADLNTTAFRIVKEATEGKPEMSVHQASGRRGGLKGGRALAEKRTAQERSEAARKAAEARWRRER